MVGPAGRLFAGPTLTHASAAAPRRRGVAGLVVRAPVVARCAGVGDGHEWVARQCKTDGKADDENEQVVHAKLLTEGVVAGPSRGRRHRDGPERERRLCQAATVWRVGGVTSPSQTRHSVQNPSSWMARMRVHPSQRAWRCPAPVTGP